MPTTPGDRRPPPSEPPTGQVALPRPPEIADAESPGGVLTNALPMVGSLGGVAVMAAMGSTTSAGRERSFLAAGAFLAATLAFVVAQLDRQRTGRLRRADGARTAYLRQLDTVRATVREAAAQQRAALWWLHPDPGSLPSLAEERSRVWERGRSAPAYLRVRYGVGSRPLSTELVPPDPVPIETVDLVAAAALHRLLTVHRTQPDLPVWVDLRAFPRLEICGSVPDARSLVRAVICSAATFHPPDGLAVAVLASTDSLAAWDWVKWLPHALSTRQYDAVGPRRMVSTDLAELGSLLPPGIAERAPFDVGEPAAEPHLLLVVDRDAPPPYHPLLPVRGLHGVTVLDLPRRWDDLEDRARLRLLLADRQAAGEGPLPVVVQRLGEPTSYDVADCCDLATAEAVARRLAPLTVRPDQGDEPSGGARSARRTDPLHLLGLPDVRRYDPAVAWRPRAARDRLRVPIGLGDDGDPVQLDLKESAEHGLGPHGLVIGATGSGKSELLRTLVLGLALTHSPAQLGLVLVDFKGGATFAGLAPLPHVSALITNLADDLALVDRMQDALSGELVRRQELLRASGEHASVRDYEQARRAGAELAPLPSLLVVVDEFSELLSARPEFVDLFVAIGRLGRSLGLHLLLASQRLEEGRLRGLESHLSYRIGLRTFSAQESRAVLGVPDAHDLPPTPGLGLLRADRSTLVRFRATYVSGPAADPTPPRAHPAGTVGILPWTIAEVRPTPQPALHAGPVEAPRPTPGRHESVLTAAVRRVAGCGPRAHRIWLPPLEQPDTLDALLPDLAPDPVLGLVSGHWRSLGGLTVPLGSVDRPRAQRRDPLTVDLAGAGGHVAVVGGPRAGKSTLLRTLVTSLALTTTPAESQFFVLDFGGGTFSGLRRLPHVAGLGTRSEPDVVRRTVAEVQGVLDRREAYFREHRLDSIETYRRRRAQGRADDGYGDVFLVVDGWNALRAEFEDVEPELQVLASRGLTFGCHVLSAASRWADYRPAMRDLFGTRLELRLGDPTDSEIDRRQAALVPQGQPGRGVLPGGHHFLAALPRVDGDSAYGSLGDGVESLVSRVRSAWRGPPAPQLRLLPDLLPVAALLDQATKTSGRRLLIGVDEKDLSATSLDVDAEPHWLVFGDGGSGRTTALRTYLHDVMRTRTPQQAQLVLVDYRRSLFGEVPDAYLLGHLTSAPQATATLTDLVSRLERRLPGPEVTAAALRSRSWWSGAEVFVLVDDYDLVATHHGSPVQVLQPLLAQGRDVGLHLVLARRAGGASRALYEPVLQTLHDLASPGLVLSGSPDEGPLVGGVRPTPARAGRGRLVTRERGVEVVQIAWRDPAP